MKFLSFSIISLRFGVDKDIGACQGSNSRLELELLPLDQRNLPLLYSYARTTYQDAYSLTYFFYFLREYVKKKQMQIAVPTLDNLVKSLYTYVFSNVYYVTPQPSKLSTYLHL